jgi:hypothetical protein
MAAMLPGAVSPVLERDEAELPYIHRNWQLQPTTTLRTLLRDAKQTS